MDNEILKEILTELKIHSSILQEHSVILKDHSTKLRSISMEIQTTIDKKQESVK